MRGRSKRPLATMVVLRGTLRFSGWPVVMHFSFYCYTAGLHNVQNLGLFQFDRFTKTFLFTF
jgi:hypothetical protein